MTFQLYDYQTELVTKARKSLTAGNKGVLIQSPPGSGKSVVIAEIARLTTDKGNRVMFLVHRKELVEQITETFKANEVNLDLCTIMTVTKVANRLTQLPKPNLIITDETHHSRAKTYRNIYDYYSDVPRLGFTATPWRMNGKGFEDIYSEMVEGKSVKWLIENNRLAPYEYYSIPEADIGKLQKSSTGDYTNQSIEQALKNSIFGDVVENYIKVANEQKTILYAHSIEYSEKFADEFKSAGIKAVHVDSKTPSSERDEIMNDFRNGKIKVLCNVDLISEGFDVPDCTCVIMARPTDSLVLYLQQSMRCMRYQPNKTATIIDHVANYTRHFLPDTDRIWNLKGFEKKRRKKQKSENEISITECPNCFGVMSTVELRANENRCPLCGFQIEIQKAEKDIVDTNLSKLDTQQIVVDYSKINLIKKYKSIDKKELTSIEDWYLYAKAHNFKDGWLKFNIPGFNNQSWAIFYQTIKPIKRKYSSIF
ncbi:DEAD/DEAH box helicase [Jeotgalibaca porci]|uniref:DEAD/DEAH box helicase n=1 Tax=Jeotgalibaca porci TaxID=1868793 RepID=UPI00359F56B0